MHSASYAYMIDITVMFTLSVSYYFCLLLLLLLLCGVGGTGLPGSDGSRS